MFTCQEKKFQCKNALAALKADNLLGSKEFLRGVLKRY
jgi:hypothetical protein